MKKRILSLLLALVMLVGMIPATSLPAFAAAEGEVYVGGVGMYDGDYLAVGATTTQTTKPSGGYAYYNDGTLTLNNYSYEGQGYVYGKEGCYFAIVYAEHDLTLELVGTNTLTQTEENSNVIYVWNGGLTVDGNGKLIGTADSYGLFAYEDLTINGGTIAVTTNYASIFSFSGNVSINGCDIIAESKLENSPCIYADYDVTINCANVTAIGGTRAISCDSFTVAKGLKIQASTTADGELGEYVAANHSNYKKIVIESFAINTVNVSATWSGTPKDATTSTKGAAVTDTKWYKNSGSNWVQLSASDTFKEGNTYRCEVTVGTTGTYTLADGYTVKINGIVATKKSGNTWYRDVAITGYSDYVEVNDIDLPEAYTNPDFTYDTSDVAPSRKHWDVAKVEWFECDKDGKKLSDALTENDVFKKDTYYRIEVTVVPETNWQFHGSDLSFYINDKLAMPIYGYNKAYTDSVTGFVVYNTADIEGDYELFVYDDSLSGSAKNIYIKDGQYLGSNATGATATKPASGGYAYYKDGVLELNGYKNEKAHFIFEELALELYLVGDNSIGAIYDNEWGMAGGNLETRQGNLVIDAADGGKLTIASNPLDAYANIQVKDLYFKGGDVTSCLANGTYGAAVQLNGDNLYLEKGTAAYVSNTNNFATATKWDGTTDISTYDCVWLKTIGTYQVEFLDDDNTVLDMVRVTEGDTVPQPEDPVKDGYKFLGWYTDGGDKFDFTTPITEDIYLTAKFEEISTPAVYVGGVGMFSGDYLAVGATATQTTKPSGGYAYYEDGKLTLNNYSYEGKGYKYDSFIGAYATVYAERKLTVELVGTNTLKQTNYNHDAIFVGDDFEGYLTIQGDGSLNATAGFGISARSTITVNGGTIVCTCTYDGMCTYNQDFIINGGNVTASGSTQYGIRAMRGRVVINGGNITATGGDRAISCDRFAVAKGMNIQASTTVDGALGEYVSANLDTYKKIVIAPTPDVYVGGVGMYDGAYLAVGATATQTTKPSGGYAYYKDGTLTLNNYSYEGEGYKYGSVYAKGTNLTIELLGDNTLVQTQSGRDAICTESANLTIGGTGNLTCRGEDHGIWVGGKLTINGGEITAIGNTKAIRYSGSKGFSVADGLTIQASTTVDGELGEYVAANHDSYKKIVIKPDAGNVLLGDVNLDGEIDAKDLTLLARHIAKIELITDQQALTNADINKDGGASSEDLTKLARHIAKIESIVQ